MDATTNIKLCNGHSRTHIRYGMEGDHITNYLPFTECKFGLKAHMEHPTTQTWKNVTCKCSARVRPKSDPCKRTLHHAIPYLTKCSPLMVRKRISINWTARNYKNVTIKFDITTMHNN